MRSSLNQELCDIMSEVAPYTSPEDYARIVKLAESTYNAGAEQFAKTASARRANADKVHEARMIDAIVQAMNTVHASIEEDVEPEYFDARGMDPLSIASEIGRSSRLSSMDVEDSWIDEILDKEETAGEYDFEDGAEEHTDRYDTPGRGRHRTDSLAR